MDVLLLGKNGRMSKKIGAGNKIACSDLAQKEGFEFYMASFTEYFLLLSCAISCFGQKFEFCFRSIRAVLFSFVSGA